MMESNRSTGESTPKAASMFVPGPFSGWSYFTRYLASLVAIVSTGIATANLVGGPREVLLLATGVLLLACHVLASASRR